MVPAQYLRFTEESNALDYLEKAAEFIRNSERNPSDWKWVIIALHGALYGFMICALKGTNADNVVIYTKNGKRRLIERCKNPAYMNMTVQVKCYNSRENGKNS